MYNKPKHLQSHRRLVVWDRGSCSIEVVSCIQRLWGALPENNRIRMFYIIINASRTLSSICPLMSSKTGRTWQHKALSRWRIRIPAPKKANNGKVFFKTSHCLRVGKAGRSSRWLLNVCSFFLRSFASLTIFSVDILSGPGNQKFEVNESQFEIR